MILLKAIIMHGHVHHESQISTVRALVQLCPSVLGPRKIIILNSTVGVSATKVQLCLLLVISPHRTIVIEGSLETKTPTVWTDKKHSQEEAEPGRNSDVKKVRREKIRDGESQKREDAGARKGRKVAKRCVFPVFCGSGGSKSRLAKAAGAETSGQMRNENCTPLWREAHFE